LAADRCPVCQKVLAETPSLLAEPSSARGRGNGTKGHGADATPAWWLGSQGPAPSHLAAAAAPTDDLTTTAALPGAAVAAAAAAPVAAATDPAVCAAEREPLNQDRSPAPEESTVTASCVPTAAEPSPWGNLAVLFGLVGFGIAWVPQLGVFGVGIGGFGLVLGLLGALLLRRRPGFAAALAGAALSLQAVLFSTAVVYGYVRLYEPAAKTPGNNADKQNTTGPDRKIVVVSTQELLEAFKSKDADVRKKAIDSLAEMARGVAEAVPALTDPLLNDDDARVRAGFAAALGNLGPQARSAYPALLNVKERDVSPAVQEAATTALEKIGKPSTSDVPFLVKGLEDKRSDYRASVAQTLSWVCTPENKLSAPLLKDALAKEPETRVKLYLAQALWAVDRQPHEVLKVFRDALHYPDDPAIRAGAALALNHLGQEARLAAPDLRRVLDDPNMQVRLYAAQVLWYLERNKDTAEMVVPVLGKVLKAEDRAYRADAAQVLINIGPRAVGAIDDLIEALKDPTNDPDLRSRCAFALGAIGPDAAPATKALAELVRSGGGALSEQAASALYLIGPRAVDAVPALTVALSDPNIQLRGRAALALSAIGEDARSATEALKAALEQNKDPNIRVLVARALCMVNPPQQELALPVLLEVAQDTSQLWDLRAAAVETLGFLGPVAKAAHPTLLRIQGETEEPRLKATAVAAAGRIGPVTAENAAALIKALGSPSVTYRKAAAETLAALGPDAKEAVGPLKLALADKDLGLRLAAALALGDIGPEAREATVALGEVLKEPIPELQGAALEALRKIGPDAKEVMPQVLARVADKDPRVQAAALLAGLGIASRDAKFLKAVEGRLTDKDGRIRVVAAEILWHVKKMPDLVVPVLTEALSDPKVEVQTAAIGVLHDIGTDAKAAIPRLTELTKQGNEEVRKAAIDALKKIVPTNP
jgi:HEAT repeat protein